MRTRWIFRRVASIGLERFAVGFTSVCRELKMGSNMIVLEVDSLFPDFGRFIIMGFFIDPPAVGPVFPFEISQIIAMLGASQKTGDQEKNDNGRRDKPAFCNQRSH